MLCCSATSATALLHSSASWLVATKKGCRCPDSPQALYSSSKALRISAGGWEVSAQSRSQGVDTDGRLALQLTTEPLTTHEVVVASQGGAERPQPWRDAVARGQRRDLPMLQATM